MHRRFRVAPFVASVLVLSACAGEPADPGPSVGVYSEFLGYGDVPRALPALAGRGADLNLVVSSPRIGEPALPDLLRAAEAQAVGVRLWLVLSREDGYWPNEANAELFAAEVRRLLDWLEAEDLAADAVVYDMEPGLAYTEELRSGFDGGFAGLTELLRSHMDAASFEAARETFAASAREVSARGLSPVCVTYPQIVDDLLDGDDDYQDALDVPVRGVPFDEVAFMVYQTAFAEAVGGWVGPALVGSFAADARALFGERAVIALGQVGPVGIFEPTGPVYTDPADLAADVAAARAEGIGRVEVYSLDGMMLPDLGPLDRWLHATRAAPARAGRSGRADLTRTVAQSIDTSLDAE